MESLTVEIIDYKPEHAHAFRDLNLQWISDFFEVEPIDSQVLDNPDTEIIAKGGSIFLARYENQIVGCCAMLKESHKLYELSKMAVAPEFQGKHIGKQILIKAIDFAKKQGVKQVKLYSHSKLVRALELYRTFGFQQVPLEATDNIYKRSDVKMILNLK